MPCGMPIWPAWRHRAVFWSRRARPGSAASFSPRAALPCASWHWMTSRPRYYAWRICREKNWRAAPKMAWCCSTPRPRITAGSWTPMIRGSRPAAVSICTACWCTRSGMPWAWDTTWTPPCRRSWTPRSTRGSGWRCRAAALTRRFGCSIPTARIRAVLPKGWVPSRTGSMPWAAGWTISSPPPFPSPMRPSPTCCRSAGDSCATRYPNCVPGSSTCSRTCRATWTGRISWRSIMCRRGPIPKGVISSPACRCNRSRAPSHWI